MTPRAEQPTDATPPDDAFTQSFAASDWAEAFVKRVRANPDIATDVSTMLGWFANAIMRGHDEHARRAPVAEPPHEHACSRGSDPHEGRCLCVCGAWATDSMGELEWWGPPTLREVMTRLGIRADVPEYEAVALIEKRLDEAYQTGIMKGEHDAAEPPQDGVADAPDEWVAERVRRITAYLVEEHPADVETLDLAELAAAARASRRTPTGQADKDPWLAAEARRVMTLSHDNVLREWTDRTGKIVGPDNDVSIQIMRATLMHMAIVEDAARASRPVTDAPAVSAAPTGTDAPTRKELDMLIGQALAHAGEPTVHAASAELATALDRLYRFVNVTAGQAHEDSTRLDALDEHGRHWMLPEHKWYGWLVYGTKADSEDRVPRPKTLREAADLIIATRAASRPSAAPPEATQP